MAFKKFKMPVGTNLKNFIYEVSGLILKPENRVISLVWAACLVSVLILGNYVQKQSVTFIGIADSKEIVVNFEHAVNVQRILVTPGQSVLKGDLLAEVEQPELALKVQGVRATIAKLQAEINLRNEMSQLAFTKSSSKSASKAKVKKAVQKVVVKLDVKLDPLASEIKSLQQQLAVLESRERDLYVFAEINGVIGSIHYKKGETVAPYAALLTISPGAPTFVQGYLHESLQARYVIGQKVMVRSIADSSHEAEGRIIGLSSRLSELPVRMVRMQGHKIWGREITIEVPAKNSFLLGEKVEVGPSSGRISFSIAQAEDGRVDKKIKKSGITPSAIAVPESIRVRSSFEPSGVIYLNDLRKYLVISDDTDDFDSPFLFLMNPDGSIDANLVKIEGIERIEDAESISQDASGDIYVMSSQSRNRSGKVKHDRKIFVKLKRNGLRLIANGSVSLRDILISAALESKDKEITQLANDFDKDLEIEGHYIDGGRLFVALKSPGGRGGQGVILDLGKVDYIFSKNKIDPYSLKIAHHVEFPESEKQVHRIADIVKAGNKLVLSTASKGNGTLGRIWAFDLLSKKLSLLNEFPGHIPEGLAFDSTQGELMVLFDEGSESGLFTKLNDFIVN